MPMNFLTPVPHIEPLYTRRDFLMRGGAGFGALALTYLMSADKLLGADKVRNPLAAKPGHFPARAKSVIFLFMEGGPSHLDTFDPKPQLNELAGKPIPPSFKPVITAMGEFHSPLLASKRKWARYGKGGLWISDWYPHVAQCADDLAVLRSCWQDGINHSGGVCQMNTGSTLAGPAGPALAGVRGYLRPRHREREPSGLRRPAGQSRHGRERAPQLGRRLHA